MDKGGGSTHRRIATGLGLSHVWRMAGCAGQWDTEQSLGDPKRADFMLRVWGVEESLGRKSYAWPVSTKYKNPAPSECGGNPSCQAARGRKGNTRNLQLAAYFKCQRKAMQRSRVGRGGVVLNVPVRRVFALTPGEDKACRGQRRQEGCPGKDQGPQWTT